MLSRRLRAALCVSLGAILLSGQLISPAYADTNVSLPFKVNFQAESTTTPSGYTGDYGQAYDATRGWGWTDASGVATSLVGNGRERGVNADKRLDTFMHMQLLSISTGVTTEGRWKAAVPNGTYQVTVAAGDPSYIDSHNVVRVEEQTALDFIPTGTITSQTNTVTVDVTDSFLNVDAVGGSNTKIDYIEVQAVSATSPTVVAVTPEAGATGVSTGAAVTVQLSNGVLATSVDANSLKLIDPNNNVVAGFYNVDGAYSNATFVPSAALSTNTRYTVQTTTALKDPEGNSYTPFTSSFTTGTSGVTQAPVSFTKSVFDAQDGPTAMTIGPDGHLYVATINGAIFKYELDAEGKKVGSPVAINNFLFTRIVTSIRFDPSSTATDPKLWVSHGFLCDGDCANFTGIISVLTGSDLSNRRDVITGLPRSIGNHMNNGLEFGADGKLYWAQGANTGFGAPDAIWGNRAEDPLTAAILVADVNRDTRFQGTVNVDTSAGYNPNATDAPVKVFASGIRNPYSVLSHSNGRLYSPVNESANGNTPAGPNNVPPALKDLPAGDDYFTEVIGGKYYGHPNPARGEYVLNGGNPTESVDSWEVPQYPVGTAPDANYRAPDVNLGLHRSANGSAEFKSDVFGGTLKGQILVTEYAQGKDVIAVALDSSGKPMGSPKQVAAGFFNPLGITVHQESGRVYVGEFGADPTGEGGQITLLTPNLGTGEPVDPSEKRFNFTTESGATPIGYTNDFGEAYSSTRGYGWETLTGSPVSLVGNGRERNIAIDERLKTLMHMQLPSGVSGVATEGRWQLDVPNGTYTITVAAGDAQYYDSTHVLRAEGNVILEHTPSSTTPNRVVTVDVAVGDGNLTIDAVGGANTKINYIDVAPQTTTEPVPVDDIVAKVNFSPENSMVSDDYSLDYGQPFDSARGFGWQDLNGAALSLVGNARDRNLTLEDRRLSTFIHMQLPTGAPGVSTPGRWEMIVPNGTYKVTVAVGDPSYYDSHHVIRAEGTVIVDHTPTSTAPSKVVTAEVAVNDGRLTLDPVGGTNTKLAYVDVFTSDGSPPPADTTAPDVTVTPSGTTNSTGEFVGSATVTIDATDIGSGIKNVTYVLDGGAVQAYNEPFTVSSIGSHTVVATAVDNADNTKSVTKTFTIVEGTTTPADMKVIGTEDYLGLGTRLVFSTVGYEVRPAKNVTIQNTGTSTLNITNMTFSGPQANAFKFNTGQLTSFSVAPGASASVPINFRPVTTQVNSGVLTISSNDSAASTYQVSLGGINPPAYEDVYEPSLQEIAGALGYNFNAGVTDESTNFISKSSGAVGDELISHYWKRVDTSKPVNLYPMAHYSGRSTATKGPFGVNAQNSTSTKLSLLSFPGGSDPSGGENQRLLPGMTSGSTTSFSPSSTYTPFGVFGPDNAYSDDLLTGGGLHHAMRFYPAKNAAGVQVPNTWVVGIDIGTVDCCYKNWDYQDYVFLLTNAEPNAGTPAPAPGAASLNLGFGAAVSGTVADSTGKGTGFNAVQANSAGDQHEAARLVLDTTTGHLKVTSSAGTNTNTINTQKNALQLNFDGTGANWRTQARLIGPFTNLVDGVDQQAIYFGPNQDNYIKLEVEYAAGSGVVLTIWREVNGSGQIMQRISMPDPSASTLDLYLDGNPTNGTVQASYRLNSASTLTAIGSASTVPAGWFNTSSKSGLLVSHAESTTSFTATYDSFAIIKN